MIEWTTIGFPYSQLSEAWGRGYQGPGPQCWPCWMPISNMLWWIGEWVGWWRDSWPNDDLSSISRGSWRWKRWKWVKERDLIEQVNYEWKRSLWIKRRIASECEAVTKKDASDRNLQQGNFSRRKRPENLQALFYSDSSDIKIMRTIHMTNCKWIQ